MTFLDRHVAFLEALRDAGLPVSLAEGLDGMAAIQALGLGERETLRAAYAATLVKRKSHRTSFDKVFDLYFPPLVGAPGGRTSDAEGVVSRAEDLTDGPEDLSSYRDQLAEALSLGDEELLTAMAREGVQRFGMIRGRGPGDQRWSTYNVMNRVAPAGLVDRILAGLAGSLEEAAADPSLRRAVEAQISRYQALVEAEVNRRAAEIRDPAYVAQHTVRPSIEKLDFTAARKADLEQMRRELYPLARRLATHMSKQQHARGRGPLDFRRTVRASLGNGGVPLDTHHKPKRPGRTDLVVLCDVSGSVANFANFTLMLVFALREQFNRVRAFTFVDDVHEVTDRFTVGGDPVQILNELAASAQYASLWGRTNYGRAFTRFEDSFADALTPRTNLLILGDARSNYSDLGLPMLKKMAYDARNSWWLNPESAKHWNTGDSAARDYGAVVPMRECRNLTQLGDFIHELA